MIVLHGFTLQFCCQTSNFSGLKPSLISDARNIGTLNKVVHWVNRELDEKGLQTVWAQSLPGIPALQLCGCHHLRSLDSTRLTLSLLVVWAWLLSLHTFPVGHRWISSSWPNDSWLAGGLMTEFLMTDRGYLSIRHHPCHLEGVKYNASFWCDCGSKSTG